ncbi:hypothetical protein NDU88_008655 [Pleurodeles waltl]|uniref:Uncharacterized protein n=1 Tax=Pleurodeles waltl TaxID=8319 RepID=A0AAV7NZW6_PLEWA|nr:hypothetical protein NDU88_008655 [Pleurodeles waltl]
MGAESGSCRVACDARKATDRWHKAEGFKTQQCVAFQLGLSVRLSRGGCPCLGNAERLYVGCRSYSNVILHRLSPDVRGGAARAVTASLHEPPCSGRFRNGCTSR